MERKNNNNAKKCILLGRRSVKRGDWVHAASMFRKAVKLDPYIQLYVKHLMIDLDVKKKAAEAKKEAAAKEKADAEQKAKQEDEKRAKDEAAKQENEKNARDDSEVIRIIKSTKKCLDRETAFEILNLNEALPKKMIREKNWSELRQHLREEFRKISNHL